MFTGKVLFLNGWLVRNTLINMHITGILSWDLHYVDNDCAMKTPSSATPAVWQ